MIKHILKKIRWHVYFGGVGWKRFFACGVFYFFLQGDNVWLQFDNNRLRALLYIELRKYHGSAFKLMKKMK